MKAEESLSILANGIIDESVMSQGDSGTLKEEMMSPIMSKEDKENFKWGGTPFIINTYQLVGDQNTSHLVAWSPTKDSFIVLNTVDFTNQILPKYFKHSNFNSFLRQLNAYGFRKTENKWEFKHECFKEGQPQLLQEITRKRVRKQLRELSPIKMEGETPVRSSIPEFDQVERLKDTNVHILNCINQLSQQQKTTMDTVSMIWEELQQSRRDQSNLHKTLETLLLKRKLDNGDMQLSKAQKTADEETSASVISSLQGGSKE